MSTDEPGKSPQVEPPDGEPRVLAIVRPRLTIAEVMQRLTTDCDFSNENLSDLNLTRLKLSKARFRHADLSGARLHGAELDGADFFSARLHGTDFSRAKCVNAIFQQASIDEASFTGAIAENACFAQARISNTYFFDADLRRADFTKSTLQNIRFDSGALDTQDEARLTGARFDEAHCDAVNFARTVLGHTSMRNVSFGNSNLKDTLLHETDMEGADLRQTSGFTFDNTYLRGARLPRRPTDRWSRLRREYSGPKLFFHVLLLIAFLLPYVAQIVFWKSVNESQLLLKTLQKDLEEIERELPPSTLAEMIPAELEALWLRDGLDSSLLPDALALGISAFAATPKHLRGEIREVKNAFERLWHERGLDPAALPKASWVVPAHAEKLWKRVAWQFQTTEDSLEQMWKARGIDPGLLPDARAILINYFIRVPEELRMVSLRRFSQAIRRIEPCAREQCGAPVRVGQLLLGFGRHRDWWKLALTLLLFLYNLLRGLLTWFISPLRDEEDRTGYSPSLSEYRYWFWPYWPMTVLVYAAIIAFALHAWEYLFQMTVILPR